MTRYLGVDPDYTMPYTCDTCVYLDEDGTCFMGEAPVTRDSDVSRYFFGTACEWYL